MSLMRVTDSDMPGHIPRVSGDEPRRTWLINPGVECSLRERG